MLPDLGRLLSLALLPLALLGCRTTYGARTVQPTRAHYSTALSHSWNEHLLLNLVRLRYRDTVQFLTVGDVVTQFTFAADASAGLILDVGGDDSGAVGGRLAYSESPTITYQPLHGEDFVKRMLTPLAPENLMLLANSGWSIGRLMMCCVSRINGIENAPSAAGPTPDYWPNFEEFRDLSQAFRELQKAGHLKFSLEEVEARTPKTEVTTGASTEVTTEITTTVQVSAHILRSKDPALRKKTAEVLKTLSIDEDVESLEVVAAYSPSPEGNQLALVGRSLVAVFFYLSQGVKPPPEHEEAGLVTVTKNEEGRRLEWWAAMNNHFKVHSSREPPQAAFARVRHRGYWFYIEDSDRESKTTFSLLTFLFSMQASSGAGRGPVLTLSAGR